MLNAVQRRLQTQVPPKAPQRGAAPEPPLSPERSLLQVLLRRRSIMEVNPTNPDVRETHNLIASDKVEGTPVRRSDGEKIGTIERVMIDKRGGKVAYAVMSFGGFMGLGEEYYTLPWSVLTYNTSLDAYELNLSEDQLRGAPRRSAEGHDPSFDRDWEEHVHRYYNATPYWGASDPMSKGR
jgi:sporulation protein YlmC with PRC-barrel domain